ncbi:hypothetical protein JL720_10870 [Aureococcus anophagefferens]|nr:hypothetical protein JL720_10870 [Aureococcus anophagefferens]
MGAGATSARALLDAEGRWPEIIDKPTAEKLVAQTPGIAWDDDKWREVANEDRAARADIIALLDRLRVGDDGEARTTTTSATCRSTTAATTRSASPGRQRLGGVLRAGLPGTFSVDADEGDDLPGMEFADGTGGLSLVGKPIAGGSPASRTARGAATAARSVTSVVEEVIAADGTAFDQLNPNAPGTFDEDAELGGATPRGDGEKRPHIDLGISGPPYRPRPSRTTRAGASPRSRSGSGSSAAAEQSEEKNEALLRKFMPGLHNASRSTQLQHAVGAGQARQRASVKMNDNRHLLERSDADDLAAQVASMRRDAAKREELARLEGVKRMVHTLRSAVEDHEAAKRAHDLRVETHLMKSPEECDLSEDHYILRSCVWSWFTEVFGRRVEEARDRLEAVTRRKASVAGAADFGEPPLVAPLILRCIFERWQLYVDAATRRVDRGKFREINRIYDLLSVPRTHSASSQHERHRTLNQEVTMLRLQGHRPRTPRLEISAIPPDADPRAGDDRRHPELAPWPRRRPRARDAEHERKRARRPRAPDRGRTRTRPRARRSARDDKLQRSPRHPHPPEALARVAVVAKPAPAPALAWS